MAEGDRVRRKAKAQNRVNVATGFQNPYSYMSDPEAMVKLLLDNLRVPYSWRYFDAAPEEAPTLRYLIPDFAPEFTLREYKLVIIVVGGFYGTLPGVLDKTALAMVALEQDGWRGVMLLDAEIRRNVREALVSKVPELAVPAITGGERENPYGAKELMTERLKRLGGYGLKKRHFIKQDRSTDTRRNSDPDRRRNRLRRRRRQRGADVRAPVLDAPDV
jgi:hypothetical protein